MPSNTSELPISIRRPRCRLQDLTTAGPEEIEEEDYNTAVLCMGMCQCCCLTMTLKPAQTRSNSALNQPGESLDLKEIKEKKTSDYTYIYIYIYII